MVLFRNQFFFFCRYVTLLYKSTHTLLFRSKRTSFEKLIRDGAAATARLSETFDRNISFLLLIKGCIIIGNGVLMSHFNRTLSIPTCLFPSISYHLLARIRQSSCSIHPFEVYFKMQSPFKHQRAYVPHSSLCLFIFSQWGSAH